MEKIAEKISLAQNIVVTAHMNEDADALGSSFALCEALRKSGKNVTLYLSEQPEERLRFMKCDYIIFEDGMNPEQDLLVVLDAADKERLGSRGVLLDKSESVLIDHHCTNTGYCGENYIKGDASSTGELVFNLLKLMGMEITKTVAEFLYVAISGDTGSFKYSCTSPDTMRAVAELMETGIDHAELSRRVHEQDSIEAVKLNGYLMSNVLSYFDGALRMVVVEKDLFERFSVDEKNAGDIVNIPRRINGTEIAVSVRETEEKIKMSFRSNGKYDVTGIAAKFGGGGHKMAAGASATDMSVNEVIEKIKQAVGEIIND